MPTDWGGGAGADIGRTLIELGRIRGENSVQQGNIWGHAIANIGNTIENAPLIQMRQQEMQARTAELQGVVQARQRLAAGQQALAQLLRDPANLEQDTGMVDHRKVATALGQQGFADMGESYLKQAAANEEAFGKIDEQKQKYLGIVGRGAAKVNSPEDFTTMLSVAGQLNVPPAFLDHISKEADKLGPDGWKVVSQKLADMAGEKPKYAPLPENSAGVVNESTGQITPTGQPRVFKNETELLSDAADPNSPTQQRSKDALALKATPDKMSPEEQYLDAITKGDRGRAQNVLASIRATATAKSDPAQKALANELANLRVDEAKARLADLNGQSVKAQEGLEQKYRDSLQRVQNSRAGGLGIEDQKVNQAVHLLALLEQNKDPRTGTYTMPRVMQTELALGLARLISPSGQVGAQLENEINQHTLKGDLAGALTYITGQPVNGNPQAITQMYRDSIERQGRVAEENRDRYMAAARAEAPTDLSAERRAAVERGLGLLTSVKNGSYKAGSGSSTNTNDAGGWVDAGNGIRIRKKQ